MLKHRRFSGKNEKRILFWLNHTASLTTTRSNARILSLSLTLKRGETAEICYRILDHIELFNNQMRVTYDEKTQRIDVNFSVLNMTRKIK